MFKKVIAILTVAVLAVSLAACGASASSNKSDESLVKAVVVSSVDGMLKVNANNYEMSFSEENVETMPAVAAGDKVLLTYTGTIKGADNSKAQLINVEVLSSQAASSAASSSASSEAVPTIPASPMNPGPVKTGTFYGMVENASMNNFTVQNGNGATADFVIGDNTVFSTINGFVDGIMVTVTYLGDYSNADNCTVVSVVEDANDVTEIYDDEPSAENGHNGNFDDYQSISGVISEASMSNITLIADDGVEMDFFISDSTNVNVTGGLGMGKRVTVVYSGANAISISG